MLFLKHSIMMGLFKKESKRSKLEKKYAKTMKEAFNLSKSNRTASDAKYAEAQIISEQIQELND